MAFVGHSFCFFKFISDVFRIIRDHENGFFLNRKIFTGLVCKQRFSYIIGSPNVSYVGAACWVIVKTIWTVFTVCEKKAL